VWSKFPNALCSGQLPSSLRHVQPSSPAIPVNVKQELQQPIGDRCGIQPISQHTLLIGQRVSDCVKMLGNRRLENAEGEKRTQGSPESNVVVSGDPWGSEI
jgi:hypothetical protein